MKQLLDGIRGKTIAVTGASGYIGSALVDAVAPHSSEILRVSRQELVPKSGTQTLRADIGTLDCWLSIVESADLIFHLAGNTSVYTADGNPAESLNSTVLPINHLVSAARKLGRKPRIVYTSTATVYGLSEHFPIEESLEPDPITVYDLHKLFAERQLALATRQGLLTGISLRLANVYGPSFSISSAKDRGVLNRVTELALQGKDLTVYGDGNYLRDYVYIDDVVHALISAGLKENQNGVLNVATGRSVGLKDAFILVAKAAENATGTSVHVKNAPWPENANPIESRNFIADISRLATVFNCKPQISLEVGVGRMINSYIGALNE
jgi:UDP-glucose 4-epimerase